MNTHPTVKRHRLVASLIKAAATYLALFASAAAFAQTQITQRMQQQVLALQAEKASRTPAQRKMDSQLVFAAKQMRHGVTHANLPALRTGVKFERSGRAKVDIDATVSDAVIEAIERAGGEIINTVPEENAIRAFLPVQNAESIAAREDVKSIRPAAEAITNAGQVTSQGDTTHRSAAARNKFSGANGFGIKVGVISDSINDNKNSFGKSKASGDVNPNKTFILRGQAGTGIAEGLAMMEIVHDLAPAATLYFATGFEGPASMAQNIRKLAQVGCRVIIDDVSYFAESPFQDDVISRAVNDVSAQGVLFFSSAANSGNKQSGNSGTWEGDFKVGGNIPGVGDFHAFTNDDATNVVTKASGNSVFLFWSDALGKSANDYDLYVFDSAGDVVSASTNPQTGTQDPIESVPAPEQGHQIAIFRFSGQARYLHLNTNRARLAIGTSGNTKGHNASGAPNAFSVAAAPAAASDGAPGSPSGPFPNAYNGNSKVENFSSDGFRRIFYTPNGTPITPGNFSSTGGKVLIKPDLTAADGVVTTLPPSSGLNPFFGTSAAAPHAGAIAAQILSARPSATAKQVRKALNASAIDILTAGVDRTSGVGIVMTPPAINAILNMRTTSALEDAAEEDEEAATAAELGASQEP